MQHPFRIQEKQVVSVARLADRTQTHQSLPCRRITPGPVGRLYQDIIYLRSLGGGGSRRLSRQEVRVGLFLFRVIPPAIPDAPHVDRNGDIAARIIGRVT